MPGAGHWVTGQVITQEKLNSTLLNFGTAAGRPAASFDGREYFATDTKERSYDDGLVWTVLGIIAGAYAEWTTGTPGNPPAGSVRLYAPTTSTLKMRDSAGTETAIGATANSADTMTEAMLYG